MTPKLVCVVGSAGSNKSAIADALQSALKQDNHNVNVISIGPVIKRKLATDEEFRKKYALQCEAGIRLPSQVVNDLFRDNLEFHLSGPNPFIVVGYPITVTEFAYMKKRELVNEKCLFIYLNGLMSNRWRRLRARCGNVTLDEHASHEEGLRQAQTKMIAEQTKLKARVAHVDGDRSPAEVSSDIIGHLLLREPRHVNHIRPAMTAPRALSGMSM